MTKQKITVSIDEDILKIAKKQMPNISEFFNECLKEYLGLTNGTYPTSNAQELLETIGKSQAKLFILNESFDVQESMKLIEDEKINRPFRALWNDYKRRLKPNQELMQEVMKIVDIDEETLEDLLDYTYVNKDQFGLNITWQEVYTKYQEEEMG